MALDADKLIDLLDKKATSYLGDGYPAQSPNIRETLFRVIAEAVVEHIQNNAEVVPPSERKTPGAGSGIK